MALYLGRGGKNHPAECFLWLSNCRFCTLVSQINKSDNNGLPPQAWISCSGRDQGQRVHPILFSQSFYITLKTSQPGWTSWIRLDSSTVWALAASFFSDTFFVWHIKCACLCQWHTQTVILSAWLHYREDFIGTLLSVDKARTIWWFANHVKLFYMKNMQKQLPGLIVCLSDCVFLHLK